MKEEFIEWNPKPDTIRIVEAAVQAADDMRGYEPTLRTVYYQLVANKTLDNTQKEYGRLKGILTKARNAGMMDWNSFTDKGRTPSIPWIQEDPSDVLSNLDYAINFDMWKNQDWYVEVWVEKQAQEGVVRRACDAFRTPWLSCKGFVSATAAYNAGKRFAEAGANGKRLALIHLGDHDPSGIDMTRDNQSRIQQYGWIDGDVKIDRIALNMDQIEEHRLPPDPAKQTDSRYLSYAATYGDESWELDAIRPQLLEPIIKDAIRQYIDPDAWNDVRQEEEKASSLLEWIGQNPESVLEFAREQLDWEA